MKTFEIFSESKKKGQNGRRKFTSWFRRVGNPPIKLAIVTHSHVDHFGGLTALCHEDVQRIETIAVLNDAGLRTQPRSEDSPKVISKKLKMKTVKRFWLVSAKER